MYRIFLWFLNSCQAGILGQIILQNLLQIPLISDDNAIFQRLLIRFGQRFHRAGEDLIWLFSTPIKQGDVPLPAANHNIQRQKAG